MKTPEEMLNRGNGNFINCTDYDDAIKAMKEYAAQEVAKVIFSNPPVTKLLTKEQFMRKISEVKVGEKINHTEKGKGIVISVTKRTITVKYLKSTCKNTYKHNDSYFYGSDF